MLWTGILIALLLSVVAIVAVVWPLLKKGPTPVLVEDDRLTELLLRKEQVLVQIKELEFDYRVGKLDEEDYQRFDERLRRQAVGLIQQIEQVAPESAGLDATLESEIQKRRMVKPEESTPAPAVDAGIEAEIASRRRVAAATPVQPAAANGAAEDAPRFCTECGSRVAAQHKFCASCGAPLAELATTPQ
ncbi:MAG: zinc ribbon domain-containing protein [Caldilinea sp.]|nr:hypothetical protein [Caldilineaceae bacterium]MCB9119251.1 hypothetical protein [Caldilineaceae bacterium]MCO5209469.1 zinc ribbon domain-containing protein [Caldilinea sp.]MCW5840480.1 hypothetical protein [Caldilinea sp.]